MMIMMIIIVMMFNDHQLFLSLQEVSIHVYEKRGTERVGRGRRKEAIAEILKVIEINFDYVEEHFFDESIIYSRSSRLIMLRSV